MKSYIFSLMLAAGFISQSQAGGTFEISEQEVKQILETKSFTKENENYTLDQCDSCLENFIKSEDNLRIQAKVDGDNSEYLKLYFSKVKMNTEYTPISLDDAYSFSDEFAKKYICYKHHDIGGGYYLMKFTPVVDQNGPIFEEVFLPPLVLKKAN